MEKKLFGTDGIRDLANGEIFSNLSLNILSRAIINNKKNLKIAIGRDTRKSSKIIENALVKGLKKNGARVYLIGLISTPAVSYLTKKFNCNLGIVVSASHNPYQYNGIKFFNQKGEKLSGINEKEIEKNFYKFQKTDYRKKNNGTIKRIKNSFTIYKKKILSNLKEKSFPNQLKIVVDCANGSTYKISKYIFSNIKIKFIFIKDKPNGTNINFKCGSMDTNNLIKEVKKRSADFGISFDGDGDRIICCDEKGQVVDGDKILACIVRYFYKESSINSNAVVGTFMSNTGLEKFVNNLGLKFYRAKVGDKFVYDLMIKKKSYIGGEQSGHIILKQFAPSGDGILIAIQLIQIMSKLNKKASEIFNLYKPYNQIQTNIRLKDSNYSKNKEIRRIIKLYNNKEFNGTRVLIRYSGTEPILRLLVEGEKISRIKQLANNLRKKISNII